MSNRHASPQRKATLKGEFARGHGAAAVSGYLAAATSVATRRAYASDVARFERAGYSIPCSDHDIARYLAENAATLAVATMRRHLVAIGHAHIALRCASPVFSPLVKAVLRGIRRTQGVRQRQVEALDRPALLKALSCMRLRDSTSKALWLRNRALLLVGFAGAFRRSELSALRFEDVRRTRGGIEVILRRSKTDQEAVGRMVRIPSGRGQACPVDALQRWVSHSGIREGALFRSVDRHGNVSAVALSPATIACVVKRVVALAGFDSNNYSGHSLRAGYVTTAAAARVPEWQIRQVTGHRSSAVLARYVRSPHRRVARLL